MALPLRQPGTVHLWVQTNLQVAAGTTPSGQLAAGNSPSGQVAKIDFNAWRPKKHVPLAASGAPCPGSCPCPCPYRPGVPGQPIMELDRAGEASAASSPERALGTRRACRQAAEETQGPSPRPHRMCLSDADERNPSKCHGVADRLERNTAGSWCLVEGMPLGQNAASTMYVWIQTNLPAAIGTTPSGHVAAGTSP